MRHVALAYLVAVSPIAVAAPVPKQLTNENVVNLFGTPTEPKGCSITFDKAEKSITLTAVPSPDQPGSDAGQYHVLWSPRTGREVDGDFDVTVKITLPDQSDTSVTAGLYASYGEKDYAFLGRTLESGGGVMNRRGNTVKSVITDKVWNSQGGDWKVSADEFSVRLTKKGKTITPYRLIDGKWEGIPSADTTHDWPGKGTVGVYVRAAKGEGTATFREFKLTQPEK
jgi:hypothetical protein